MHVKTIFDIISVICILFVGLCVMGSILLSTMMSLVVTVFVLYQNGYIIPDNILTMVSWMFVIGGCLTGLYLYIKITKFLLFYYEKTYVKFQNKIQMFKLSKVNKHGKNTT